MARAQCADRSPPSAESPAASCPHGGQEEARGSRVAQPGGVAAWEAATWGLECVSRGASRTFEGAAGSGKKPTHHCWSIGSYHIGLGVRWVSLDSEHEARRSYTGSWCSRVLFCPKGVPLKCTTGPLDLRGIGVVHVLRAHRGEECGSPTWSASGAIDSGEAPFIPPERLPFVPELLQRVWGLVATRKSVSMLCSESLCYLDVARYPAVKGLVALTIDDVPCRLGNANSMVPRVQSLLAEHGAKATFMIMGKFVHGNEADLLSLLRDGHELGNHGLVDRRYDQDSEADFARAFDECSSRICGLQREAGVSEGVQWFRAPHGRYSKAMAKVVRERGSCNVMCDTFACCPVIQDGNFIGDFLAQSAQDGSIIVIHMPEQGFREWCFTGIERLLAGLEARGLRAVTVGELVNAAGYQPLDEQSDEEGEAASPGWMAFPSSDSLPSLDSTLCWLENRGATRIWEENWGSARKPSKTCWVIGCSTNSSVRWASFAAEPDARRLYSGMWRSRVLFSPDGDAVRCTSGPLDLKGVGVAYVLRAYQCDGVELPTWSATQAIESGEAPFIPPERLPIVTEALQRVWGLVATRASVSWWCQDSLCHFDASKCPEVKGFVALTIDDVPCRLGNANSMVPQVQALLAEHGAQATFMIMGKFVQGNEADLVALLRDGHELGNHGLVDRRYDSDSEADFALALDECSRSICSLQREAGVSEGVQWFRAPHGRYSKAMAKVVRDRGLSNVMCDTYACCPVIQDGNFIGDFLGGNAQDGSIIVIHMPERGFRDWCFTGIQGLLAGLEARGLRAVTVGQLARLAGFEAGDEFAEASSSPVRNSSIGSLVSSWSQFSSSSWKFDWIGHGISGTSDGCSPSSTRPEAEGRPAGEDGAADGQLRWL